MLQLIQLSAEIGQPLLHLRHHLGLGARDEGLVAELLFGGLQAFFVFGEVFGQAFALGGDVDLALVDDLDVEGGCALGFCGKGFVERIER